jgi:hypothetical protein
LTQLRLCFQVYLRDSLDTNQLVKDKYHILQPIVSNVISNTPRQSLLVVAETFNLTSSAAGGVTVPVFLKKLANDHKPLNAKFYDDFGWSSEVKGINIHYQVNKTNQTKKTPIMSFLFCFFIDFWALF